MLERNSVARPAVSGEWAYGLRPKDYGRAIIINAESDAPTKDWALDRECLLDLKGVGVPPGYRSKHALHQSGTLRLDEAVYEAIIAAYIGKIAACRALDFQANQPLAILDTGYRTRALTAAQGNTLTPAAILVRQFCEREKLDLPHIDDTDHIKLVLSVELDLISIGLTTLTFMNYTLKRLSETIILSDVMGGLRKHLRGKSRGYEFLCALLGTAHKRQFAYPNVQTGMAPGQSKPVLIDLGGIDIARKLPDAWILRAHGCDYQIARLDSTILRHAADAAKDLRESLCRAVSDAAAHQRLNLERIGRGINPNWGSGIEIISVAISKSYEIFGRAALGQIEDVAQQMFDSAIRHL